MMPLKGKLSKTKTRRTHLARFPGTLGSVEVNFLSLRHCYLSNQYESSETVLAAKWLRNQCDSSLQLENQEFHHKLDSRFHEIGVFIPL